MQFFFLLCVCRSLVNIPAGFAFRTKQLLIQKINPLLPIFWEENRILVSELQWRWEKKQYLWPEYWPVAWRSYDKCIDFLYYIPWQTVNVVPLYWTNEWIYGRSACKVVKCILEMCSLLSSGYFQIIAVSWNCNILCSAVLRFTAKLLASLCRIFITWSLHQRSSLSNTLGYIVTLIMSSGFSVEDT